MDRYNKKRAKIVAVWLVLFSLLIWGIYRLIIPRPTCSDGIKNQNEQEVDCGGVCAKCKKIEAEPLIIKKTGFTESGISGRRDFYAIVKNPNNSYGSKVFEYTAIIKDGQGNAQATARGRSFILPGEEKYIVENNLEAADPKTAEIIINNSNWVEFNETYEKPNLRVVNKEYKTISSGTEFSEARGLLKNESPFDFDTIAIRVILKDASGTVIGLNSTQMKTVRSGEARDFRITWPNRFPGEVDDMEAQVDINVFDSQNFIQKYYQSEQFRSY